MSDLVPKRSIEERVATYVDTLPEPARLEAMSVLRSFSELPVPVKIELEQIGETSWHSVVPGATEAERTLNRVRLVLCLGVKSEDLLHSLMSGLATIWAGDGGVTAQRYNSALAVLRSVEPTNAIEAMMAVQMVAAHDAAMGSTAMIGKVGITDDAIPWGNLASRFMRTFAAQAEALAKIRRGGEQVVKHVHVNQGGQAVIADAVHTGGKGA